MEKAQLIVGFIRSSHGVSGECRVESSSGEYEHFLDFREVTLQRNDVQKIVKVESVSIGHKIAFVKFKGIDTVEDIKKYQGWEILVPRKYCKPLQKDEWYIEDLKNCSIVWNGDPATLDAPTEIVGTITDVLEGGAGYLLEVSLSESCTCIGDELKYNADGKVRTVLVPFVNEHIGKVDLKHGRVQLMHLWILE